AAHHPPARALPHVLRTLQPRRPRHVRPSGGAPVSPDPLRYREVMGRFPSGVAVITVSSEEGPRGLTVNALASLSLEPLLLLVAFDNGARTLPLIRDTRRFGVNVLRAGQEDLARRFAS